MQCQLTTATDLNGVLGNYATLGLNIADFARYSNKPNAQNVQVIVIPIIFSQYLCKGPG